MSSRRIGLGVLLAMGAALPAQVVEGGQALRRLAAAAEAQGFRTGIEVRDLGSGEVLFRHRADEMFLPASNQKLLTVAAALWTLGSDYSFTTRFHLEQGVLRVVAGGDPNWCSDSPHAPARIFAQVAAALRAAGIRSLRGIEADAAGFGTQTRPADWPREQWHRPYCAPTAGLVLERGCFLAEIDPGRGTSAAVRIVSPPLRIRVGGRVRTTHRRKRTYAYWVSETSAGFVGHGEILAGAPAVTVRGVVRDPQATFLDSLGDVLTAAGIHLGGDPAAGATTPADSPDIDVATICTPLTTALTPILAESSNFHAEQLLRVLGWETRGDGSFAGGAAAVRNALGERLGELPAALVIGDGSGMSRSNRSSPHFLVDLLSALFRSRHSALVVQHLARGGERGTLARRFRTRPEVGRSVWAKTGTLDGVKALSGLLRRPDGRILVFSILMNQGVDQHRSGDSLGEPGGDSGDDDSEPAPGTRSAARLQERMLAALYEDA